MSSESIKRRARCSPAAALIFLLISAVPPIVTAQTASWPTQRLHTPSSSLERLPEAERTAVLRLLRPELGPLFQGEAASVVDQAIRSFRAERFSLGAFSAVALSPSGDELCSPTGNCSFWIVDPLHRRVLLHAQSVQAYAVEASRPHSVPAIITATHQSATQYEKIRWQFQDAHYEPEACATVDYADANGASLAEPSITPHPCGPEAD